MQRERHPAGPVLGSSTRPPPDAKRLLDEATSAATSQRAKHAHRGTELFPTSSWLSCDKCNKWRRPMSRLLRNGIAPTGWMPTIALVAYLEIMKSASTGHSRIRREQAGGGGFREYRRQHNQCDLSWGSGTCQHGSCGASARSMEEAKSIGTPGDLGEPTRATTLRNW